MYTISHVAELLGVPAATLRAWQRRYGVVSPKRSDAGYRLYDDADLDTLRRMQRLIVAGWSPMQAADAARTADHELTEPVPATPEAPRLAATVDGDLVAAAAALDASAVSRMLDERLAYASFEQLADGWLLPQLERLGAAWAAGQVSVAGEHLVAATVQRRLSTLYDLTGTTGRRSVLVTGLPTGCRHELGILCFAIAGRRLGMTVTHLGADLPDDDWRIAIDMHQARAAVLSVPTPEDVPPAARLVHALAGADLVVGVGGRCQQQVRQSCGTRISDRVEWLGHRIGPAAAHIASRLGDDGGSHELVGPDDSDPGRSPGFVGPA